MLKYYYTNIINYELLNKFQYKNIKQLPKVKKIVLYFSFKKVDSNLLAAGAMSLQLLAAKQSKLLAAKNFNTKLKVRKGHPVGCKVILTGQLMFMFLQKLLFTKLPLDYKKIELTHIFQHSLPLSIKNIFVFTELSENYQFFKELPKLNIVISTDSTNLAEFLFLLKALKLPIYI
uniref:Ribosomal protein L5 n=1 Tax=Toxarium undulatum TaxID=210620 RepID=A0A2U9GI60_9STRA|nr:ribosomal protein L5 [Toxarium undulatum]AWQ64146.1 ribosomal protein L5 [Toxarium undulatum]